MALAQILRRPHNFKEFRDLLSCASSMALQSKSISDRRQSFVYAMMRLDEVWFDDGLRPLYEANALVSFLCNTVASTLCEHMVDENMLDRAFTEAHRNPTTVEMHDKEFTKILKSIVAACETVNKRKVTPRFAKFCNAMAAFATDQCIEKGTRVIYVSLTLARKVVNMVLQRLLHGLLHDNDIQPSSDIPMDAVLLGAKTTF